MATITVQNTSDSGAGSLRAAIAEASASSENDTINFFSMSAGFTITLLSPITISGAGTTTITGDINGDGIGLKISGNGTTHMFDIAAGASVILKSLEFTAGFDRIELNEPSTAGAIINNGNLTIEGSLFSNNTVSAGIPPIQADGASVGSAILNQVGAQLTITESAFTNNSGDALNGSDNNTAGETGFNGGSAGTILNLQGEIVLNHVLFDSNAASGGNAGRGGQSSSPSIPGGGGGDAGWATGGIFNEGNVSGTYLSRDSLGVGGVGGPGGFNTVLSTFGPGGQDGQSGFGILTNGGTNDATGGDTLGTMGNDTVLSVSGTYYGLGGNDFLMGFGGSQLFGGAGDDEFNSNGGATMNGGRGSDTYNVSGTSDLINEDAGGGFDTVIARASFALAANDHIEIMRTINAADTDAINLTGNAFDFGFVVQTITGNAGNNILNGGADDLEDELIGLGGDDTYVLGASLMDTVQDTAGTDTITSTITRDLDIYTSIEKLVLAGSGDIDGFGTDGANTLTGNSGKNLLEGRNGADALNGGAGNDNLRGNAGGDALDGGEGSDTASYHFDGTVWVSLDGTIARFGASVGDTFISIENISGSDTGNDMMAGDINANILKGNGGDDFLFGRGGADNVQGNAGVDALFGNKGADTLTGGLGSDTMTGGRGSDKFLYTARDEGLDIVTDFKLGDKFVFEGSAFSLGSFAGNLKAVNFISRATGHKPADKNDFFIFDQKHDSLWFDADGKGGLAAIKIANLNDYDLHATDILIV
jgi:RTX calcium-binding nonapeptide repeat (4 copies)